MNKIIKAILLFFGYAAIGYFIEKLIEKVKSFLGINISSNSKRKRNVSRGNAAQYPDSYNKTFKLLEMASSLLQGEKVTKTALINQLQNLKESLLEKTGIEILATAKPSMTVTTANDGSELSLYGFDYKTAEWIEIGTANRTASEMNASCKYECALSEYYPWYCLAKPLESEKMIDVEVIFADFPSDVYNRANDFCKANKNLFTADTIYNIFGKNDSLNNGIGRIFQIWWEIKNNSKHEGELSGILGPYYEKDGREYYNLPEGIELKEGDKYSLARKNFVQALYQDVVKEPRLRSIPLPACKFSPLVWKSGKSIFPQPRLISDYSGKIKFQKPADASCNLYEGKIEASITEYGETNLIY